MYGAYSASSGRFGADASLCAKTAQEFSVHRWQEQENRGNSQEKETRAEGKPVAHREVDSESESSYVRDA